LSETVKQADPDLELVEEAKEAPSGDTRAFTQLMHRHERSILANCRYLTRSPDDAEDLAQEVFVKAFFNLDGFEGRSKFKTWLQRIKINHCLNHIKKKKGKVFVEATEPGLEQNEAMRVQSKAFKNTIAGEQRDNIRSVLESMPDTLRIPLVLCDLDGLPYQDIADSLGLGLSATKMRIKRGREEFRARYEELTGTDSPEPVPRETPS
jgi:RNA polymerase sigma factor, sigma-70 family